jgi:demethylmenaquinone methyltransferase/2-methoxy-6-polyprenyl-1,4-benzoquinol methylase
MSIQQEKICLMFDRIAGTYDSVNRVLSMGQDLRWRRIVTDRLPLLGDLRILDIATGTADLLISMCQHRANIFEAHGVDLAEKMLAIGQKKINKLELAKKITLSKADAVALPFADNSFDVVSISFGIRNFTHINAALKEIDRVLKPGGKLLILEFSLPKNHFIRGAYLAYFRHVLPFVGGIISRDKMAYRYLNETVETFPYSKAFCAILDKAGFVEIQESPLTFGIATLYHATAR